MEETVANVHLKLDELHHHDITPKQRVCQEIKNVALAAEEITENPEYIVLRRSIAVQTVKNEEVVIPKLDPALNLAPNPAAFSPESGSTMEVDVSSQESMMDISSLESLSVKDLNSEKPHRGDPKVTASSQESMMDISSLESLSEKDLNSEKPHHGDTKVTASSQESVVDISSLDSLSEKDFNSDKPHHGDPKVTASSQESVVDIARQESLSAEELNSGGPHQSDHKVTSSSLEEDLHCDDGISTAPHEELLMREEAIQKRLDALPDYQEKMRILEEGIANRKRSVLQLKMEIQERQEMLNSEEAQLADQELILKKLKTAIKIQELEAEGYKVIPRSSEDDDYVPVKRLKKN